MILKLLSLVQRQVSASQQCHMFFLAHGSCFPWTLPTCTYKQTKNWSRSLKRTNGGDEEETLQGRLTHKLLRAAVVAVPPPHTYKCMQKQSLPHRFWCRKHKVWKEPFIGAQVGLGVSEHR